MTALHLVALADCAAQPWRNGGGVTHDLLAWPPGQPPWQLRVSVATIARDGPFSNFDGVQRWFTVLSGAGVRLHWPGGAVRLLPGDPPLGFDGAGAPGCSLLAGATRDLNFMVLQRAGRARMMSAAAGQTLTGQHRWRGLYTAAPAVLQTPGRQHPLAAHSLAWMGAADADADPWTLTKPTGPAWWLTLET
ncbi:MAG: HutD family protein [Microbacteriaceae bacterium]|nr:HutD family protein [Burkholderiaceae bacterium]